jgi:Domain of unknown function (DUF4383)
MSASDSATARTDRTAVQKAALAVGIVFLAVGVLGFIPGITTNYSALAIYSHNSDALVLGVFQVSILHNIVHLLFGVAGLLLARTVSGARNYLVWGGVIYLVLFVYGLIVGQRSAANFVPVNPADDFLHLVLGVGMITFGPGLDSPESGRERSARQLTDPMDSTSGPHALLGVTRVHVHSLRAAVCATACHPIR